MSSRRLVRVRICRQQAAPALVMARDPACPVHLVEEPVHDEQQHDQRRQPGRGLHVELAAVELADEPHHEEPRRHAGRQRCAAAQRHRAAMDAVGAEEARHHRRQHQDRLQALAQHQDRAVDHDRGVAQAITRRQRRRVRRPSAGVPAQHDRRHGHSQHDRGPHVEAGALVDALPASLGRASCWVLHYCVLLAATSWPPVISDYSARVSGAPGSVTQIRVP